VSDGIVKFKEAACDLCRICRHWGKKDFNPTFCYPRFSESAEIFVESTFPKLKTFYKRIGTGRPNAFKGNTLEQAFCSTGVCFRGDAALRKTCHDRADCLVQMRAQIRGKAKNKQNKSYTEKQFGEIICSSCKLCEADDPSFCYSELYRRNPEVFINKVYPNLFSLNNLFTINNRSKLTLTQETFKRYVCETCLCFDGLEKCRDCELAFDCYKLFIDQISQTKQEKKNKKVIDFISAKQTRKQKKKGTYVVAPYASFFSSKNEAFEKEIKRILYGDKHIEQDKDKEVPGTDTAEAGVGPKD
jgi:hypothetical protein